MRLWTKLWADQQMKKVPTKQLQYEEANSGNGLGYLLTLKSNRKRLLALMKSGHH
jgi:hypothetical protein